VHDVAPAKEASDQHGVVRVRTRSVAAHTRSVQNEMSPSVSDTLSRSELRSRSPEATATATATVNPSSDGKPRVSQHRAKRTFDTCARMSVLMHLHILLSETWKSSETCGRKAGRVGSATTVGPVLYDAINRLRAGW